MHSLTQLLQINCILSGNNCAIISYHYVIIITLRFCFVAHFFPYKILLKVATARGEAIIIIDQDPSITWWSEHINMYVFFWTHCILKRNESKMRVMLMIMRMWCIRNCAILPFEEHQTKICTRRHCTGCRATQSHIVTIGKFVAVDHTTVSVSSSSSKVGFWPRYNVNELKLPRDNRLHTETFATYPHVIRASGFFFTSLNHERRRPQATLYYYNLVQNINHWLLNLRVVSMDAQRGVGGGVDFLACFI